MSGKSIISNAYLEDIGDAIRQKKGTDETYYPSQMGDAIRSIEGIIPSGTLGIDANGTYDVTQYAEAVVDVPDPVINSLTVTEDGTYSAPDGVDGYNPVTVNTGVAELQEEIDSAIEASGCDPLVEGITALTSQANATTGESDTTLTDAVGRLCEGYGGGALVTAEYIGQYILSASWENDQDGNPVAIYRVICNALGISDSNLSPINAYVMVVVDNQNTGVYSANMLYKTTGTDASYCVRNNKSMLRYWSTNISLWISESAKIDVYKLTYNLP